MDNADFLENKISLERAEKIFGRNASQIIRDSIREIEDEFSNSKLIEINKKIRGSDDIESTIMLGWKFEIMNKKSGKKSSKLLLSSSQILDIYAGHNLDKDKKNAKVSGKVIINSGIANYIMVVNNEKKSKDYYVDAIQDIKEYTSNNNLYFACKAQNYRVEKDKTDGNRPLCVWVEWKIENNKLKGKIKFDEQKKNRANFVMNNIKNLINQLNIGNELFEDNIQMYYEDI